MPDHRNSYLMGVFDGEGSISCSVINRKTMVQVRVGMNNPDLPELFLLRFGGKVRKRKQRTCWMWSWGVEGTNSIPFLEFASSDSGLILKRQQATVALELARMLKKGCRHISNDEMVLRESLAAYVKGLNKRRFFP